MKIHRLSCLILAAIVLAATVQVAQAATGNRQPLKTVPHVDLARYMGDWRVIAEIPYFAEKGCVDSIESYGLKPNGEIANTFTYRKKSLTAPQKSIHATGQVYNKTTNAEWRVTFLGLVRTKYLVIGLDPHYQWALVGHPSRNYGWILARSKTIPEELYQKLLGQLAAQGYDIKRFQKVPQSRS